MWETDISVEGTEFRSGYRVEGPTWAKCRWGGSGHLDCEGSVQITGNQMGATHPPLLLHGLGFRPRHLALFVFYQTFVTKTDIGLERQQATRCDIMKSGFKPPGA